MPRPPKRPESRHADDSELPLEENAQGPRSLSPPRFFSDNKPREHVKVDNVKPLAKPVAEDMTAAARLRLDEVSRLFPEAHRAHDRKPKQDPLPTFGRLNRGHSPQHGLGARNRLAPDCLGSSKRSVALQAPFDPSASTQPGVVSQQMEQAILCAVPTGSLGPPGTMCRQAAFHPEQKVVGSYPNFCARPEQVRHTLTPTSSPEVQMWRNHSPYRLRSGSDSFCNRSLSPMPATPYSVGAPVMLPSVTTSRPFTVQNNVGSLAQKLSTVQLGGLEQPSILWASSSTNTVQTAPAVPKMVVVNRGRSISPVRSEVGANYSTAYPPSPTVSPATSFRPVMSPSPTLPFRSIPSETFTCTVSGAWSSSLSGQTSMSPVQECPVVAPPSSPFQLGVSVADPRLSSKYRSPCRPSQSINTSVPLKDSGVPIVRQGCENADGTGETVDTATCSSSSARFSEDAHKAAPAHQLLDPPMTPMETPMELSQSEEADLEEAYILSAFRRKPKKEEEEREEEAAEASADASADRRYEEASTAGTAGATEDLPPVESLRATLQALRVQDRLARAPLEPVPTVPSMTPSTVLTWSSHGSQGFSSEQGECDECDENARGFRGEFANAHVTSLHFNADAQDS